MASEGTRGMRAVEPAKPGWGYLLSPVVRVPFGHLFSATAVGFMAGLVILAAATHCLGCTLTIGNGGLREGVLLELAGGIIGGHA
mgnify:CR=1 FL=1